MKVLCLCMVFDIEDEIDLITGQGPRDHIKLEVMSSILGMLVNTLDNKHDSILEKHCRTNFNIIDRMWTDMKAVFSDPFYHLIIIDWYFSPNYWIRERWSISFFAKTIPWFATSGILASQGQIYLPNFQVVFEYVTECMPILETYYLIELVEDDHFNNPLYCAGTIAQEQLLTISPPLYNLNQLQYLRDPAFPFYVLTNKVMIANFSKR